MKLTQVRLAFMTLVLSAGASAYAANITYTFDLTFNPNATGSHPSESSLTISPGTQGTGQFSFTEAMRSSGQQFTSFQTGYTPAVEISFNIAGQHYALAVANAAFVQDLDPTQVTYDTMNFGSGFSASTPRLDLFGLSTTLGNSDLTYANVNLILAGLMGATLETGTDYAELRNIVEVPAVPEPSSLCLLALGGVMMALRRKK